MRLLDTPYSMLTAMTKQDKLTAIRANEGRTLISEIICPMPPLVYDISNVELAAAFGADMLLLNFYDTTQPYIAGLSELQPPDQALVAFAKKHTGKLIGVNLEPVDPTASVADQKIDIPLGRTASLENVERIIAQGADYVVLTGNPKVGVSNQAIAKSIRQIHDRYGQEIIIVAGKMHSAGILSSAEQPIISTQIIDSFIDAGADIILLPAPATIPGITLELAHQLIDHCHRRQVMTMTAIGTSQEGSDSHTIQSIALHSKMAGTDIHHIGDCGYGPGIAIPENIMTYAIAIKGKRHTYRAMARSIRR